MNSRPDDRPTAHSGGGGGSIGASPRATYFKWWHDGHIADTQLPEDIVEIIIALEQIADRLQRLSPDV
jgi:hypothetical protein